jgi:hypothetical protein
MNDGHEDELLPLYYLDDHDLNLASEMVDNRPHHPVSVADRARQEGEAPHE